MRHLIAALAALAVVLPAAAPAQATTSVGVSLGLAQFNPAAPLNFQSYHSTSNFRFRWDALSPYTEMTFGFVNRAQTLSANRSYVFDTSGLGMSAGAHWGFLRAGVGLEAAWLRQIVQDGASPGALRFHTGGGFIVEPYVGVILPVLKSEVTELEISAHVPVWNGLSGLDIGPRLLLTMWLGGEGGDEEEEEEEPMEDEEETDKDDVQPGDPLPDMKPEPAPSAKPSPAPGKPAKPAKPAKPVRKPAKR